MAGGPLARQGGLLSEEFDDELLVYDEQRDVACRLNHTAALVWRLCDGKRSIDDLVVELGEKADRDMVHVALDTLVEHDLLESGYERRDPAAARVSRRRFIRRVGIAGIAAMNIPMVYSLLVPAASAAASGTGYLGYYGGTVR
ncbi:MAG TPA: PqqD family protein [Solirubrobacteraceae bacterium]|jgi:hypothetical protein|nr:PqqD family protein [Solirubrobacteraceae bacterium]